MSDREERFKAPFVVMGVGVSGVGKTTLLKPFAEQVGAHYLSADDMREELTGDAGEQSVNAKAWELLFKRAGEHLGEGHSIVVDATHARSHERASATSRYRGFGAASVIALYVEASLEDIKARNKERGENGGRSVPEHAIDRMHRLLSSNPPMANEGFDEVVRMKK